MYYSNSFCVTEAGSRTYVSNKDNHLEQNYLKHTRGGAVLGVSIVQIRFAFSNHTLRQSGVLN